MRYSIRNINTKFKKNYNSTDFSQNCENKAKDNYTTSKHYFYDQYAEHTGDALRPLKR